MDRFNFVRQHVKEYPNVSRTLMDLDAVLQAYPALLPKRELASTPSNTSMAPGSAKQEFQINLRGTIPVNYKGSVYNIPVVICVPLQYPYQYPAAYVTPTPQMLIRPSQHVDTNGRFYHPFISNWLSVTARNGVPASTLVELIRHMQTVFSQECPVYNKPSSDAANNARTGNPANPAFSRPNIANSNPYGVASPISPPPLPQTLSMPQAVYYPQSNQSSSSSLNTSPLPVINALTPVSTVSPSLAQTNPDLIALEERIKSLLSRKRAEYDAQIDSALEDNKKLLQQDTAIKNYIASLEKEKSNLNENISLLKSQIETMQNVIETEERQEPIDVDDILIVPTPLHKQLLETIADDQALEDCLYALANAFRSGKLDLASYMKNVRSLSNEQFLKRALAVKINQKLM